MPDLGTVPATVLTSVPTPAYVYDLAEIRRSADALAGSLPQPSEVYYALKANPHPDVTAELLLRGCGAEVSSPGELETALVAGADPARVLYTGPAKRAEDVRDALRRGVRTFSVDSAHGVAQLAGLARQQGVRTRYLLRVNPERVRSAVGLAMTGVPTQFGADEPAIAGDPEAFLRHPEAEFDGLHLYLATNLADTDALMAQFQVALDVAVRVQRTLGVELSTLDLGGGFAAPYAKRGSAAVNTGLAERLGRALDVSFPGWRAGAPHIVFESGRALVATSGTLITRVLDVKRTHGARIAVVDSGIHQLGGMAGLRRVPPLRPDLLPAGEAGPSEPTKICGSLCTPLDTWAGDHPLPRTLAPGDLLAVPNTGAYGLTASLALFLSHPMPAEVLVDGGRVVGASRLAVTRAALPLPAPAPAGAELIAP